jgi:hypothetical protein
VPLAAKLPVHVDLPMELRLIAELLRVIAVEEEQLPEPEVEKEIEELPVEDEMLHVLAFAICVGVEMTPGIRRMAERVTRTLIYAYCL